MKKIKSRSFFLFIILFVFHLNVVAQDSARIFLIAAAKSIISSTNTCALITIDENGYPSSRAMSPFPPEKDMTIWMATNPNSRKVEQIKNNSRVTLYYEDFDNSGYVSILGIAELVNDPKEKEKYWKEEWKRFYPDRDKSYVLIKVSPVQLEIISETREILGDSITWKATTVLFSSLK